MTCNSLGVAAVAQAVDPVLHLGAGGWKGQPSPRMLLGSHRAACCLEHAQYDVDDVISVLP